MSEELTEDEIERLALIGELAAIADMVADRWLAGERADPALLRDQRIVIGKLIKLEGAPGDTA